MGRLSGFKYRIIIKRLKAHGFENSRQARGSHEMWYNTKKDLTVLISKHGKDMPDGTLRKVLKHAKISVDDFLNTK